MLSEQIEGFCCQGGALDVGGVFDEPDLDGSVFEGGGFVGDAAEGARGSGRGFEDVEVVVGFLGGQHEVLEGFEGGGRVVAHPLPEGRVFDGLVEGWEVVLGEGLEGAVLADEGGEGGEENCGVGDLGAEEGN